MTKGLSDTSLLFGFAPKLTDEQKEYVDSIYSDKYDIIFCNSVAGTGKTTLAVAVAKILVDEGKKDGLLYVFNPVEENKMGFRPGDQYEKEREYTLALRDALIEIRESPEKAIKNPFIEVAEAAPQPKKKKDKEDSVTVVSKPWVEASSHTFFRGTNQKNKVVIIDEAQNWTVPQLRKMLTRCHDTCKIIVCGHTGQIDLPNENDSGFGDFIEHFKGEARAKICHLTINFRGWIAQHADKI
jgi:phosphate starvation-inducible protein PhoH